MEEQALLLEMFRVGVYGVTLLGMAAMTNRLISQHFKKPENIALSLDSEHVNQLQTLDQASWLYPKEKKS